MARIAWLSSSPRKLNGYGVPTALWLPVLAKMGHQVTALTFDQEEDDTWEGVPVKGTDQANDWLAAYQLAASAAAQADLLIMLMDPWAIPPTLVRDLPCQVAAWFPVDCSPLSRLDRKWFAESGAYPVPMSEWGAQVLDDAGFQSWPIPYAYDPGVFHVDWQARDALRTAAGLDGKHVVGINAGNTARKGWPEMLAAYARFWHTHHDAVVLHANVTTGGDGPDLLAIKAALDLPPQAITWTKDIPPDGMADWYRVLDVYLNGSYGEGFCLPLVEAQACGVPVICTGIPPMDCEAGKLGRHVRHQFRWTELHKSAWQTPIIADMFTALQESRHRNSTQTGRISTYVQERYAVGTVAPLWAELIRELT